MNKYKIKRSFPIWKFWKWRTYFTQKKLLQKTLDNYGDKLDDVIFKAYNDLIMFDNISHGTTDEYVKTLNKILEDKDEEGIN